MDRFKPLRSSPPYKPSKLAVDLSDASAPDTLAIELRDLSPEDVGLLEAVVQRAGPSTTTFLTVLNAYSEVLADRGIDPQEVVYYSKLLKLGTMKGRNWGEKWERVKSEWQKTKKPHRASTRTEPVHFDVDTVTDLSTMSDRTISPVPRIIESKGLRKDQAAKRTVPFSKAISRIATAVDDEPVPPPRHTSSNPSHRKRAISPVPKPKEEQARDIVARAKGRKGTVLNDADAWKNIQMQHDEENADLFRQDKLVERCWQIWQQGYRWIVKTTEQIGEARDQLLVQRSLERWGKKFNAQQHLYRHINDLSNQRVLLTFLRYWQTKFLESRQKKWRQDMRNKMKIVRQNHESKLIKYVWSRWRHTAQSKLVYQTYLDRLVVQAYVSWKDKMLKIAHLKTTADEFRNGRQVLPTVYWRKWRRAIEYRSAEATMRGLVNLRILDDTLRRWKQHLHVYAVAENFLQQHLKARIMKKWSRHLDHIQRLEKRAVKQLAKSDALLLYAIMRIWKARKNGQLLEQDRSKHMKALALRRWKAKIDSCRADQVLAESFSMRPASSLAVTTIDRWKRAFIKTQSGQQLADAFHMSHLAIISIHQWRTHLRKKIKMVKIARAAAQYFQMRRAWFRWVGQQEAKRRDQLLHLYTLNVKKRRFGAWLSKARIKRERNMAVQDMQDRISRRILRESLSQWTDRVISLKSREFDIVQHYNMVILMTAFQKLKSRHLQHVEAQNLLESFMYLKQKDLLRRAFYRWLTAARLSRHRRVVLQDKENEIRLQALEATWDRWREKSLRSREDAILLQCQRNILCSVFSKWHGRTKSPPAIRFDSLRVKNNFFKQWKRALSQENRVKEAASMDRQWVAAKFFERWLEAYRTKKTLKAVARARHLRLPSAPMKKSLVSVQTNAVPRRSDFIRPQILRNSRDDDEESDAGSVASATPLVRTTSATSSTYISGKSRAPSVISSASRYSIPKRHETSPTRTLQVPTSISRARSETGSSSPRFKKGPSSVASADLPRRAWPGMQRGTRPFFQRN